MGLRPSPSPSSPIPGTQERLHGPMHPCTGPKPHELYGKFTWKIENFSEISKRELRSNIFDVGNYKW
jgi:hypothetical protein